MKRQTLLRTSFICLMVLMLALGFYPNTSRQTSANTKFQDISQDQDLTQTSKKQTNNSINGSDNFEVVSTTGITPNFRSWLTANGYSGYDFARDDLTGGSYGGRESSTDTVVNQPVIFIHGNSDKAVGSLPGQTGWTASIDYFMSKGYKTSELYATTYGPANALFSSEQYHSRAYLTKLRNFIQAVKQYTGATKVDIVAHSLGVTLARKAIKGGMAYDPSNGGYYDLGAPLTSSIDTFVGIAGANRGLTSCYLTGGTTLTCDDEVGLYPGYTVGFLGPYNVSSYLVDLNASSHYEGSYVYSIWSSADEVVGYGTLVWGQYTCRIPGQNGEKTFSTAPYGHFGSKDLTGYYQWRMVKSHATN